MNAGDDAVDSEGDAVDSRGDIVDSGGGAVDSEGDAIDSGGDTDADDGYDLESGPDPAEYAAAAPEPEWAGGAPVVHAVGIGPGNREFLLPRAERAIREADVVVGFETVVEFVADVVDAAGGDALTCGYRDEDEALERFADRVAAGESGTAVLMGDPNHSGYQFLGKVERAVDEAFEDGDGSDGGGDGGGPHVPETDGLTDDNVRVVPGISSLQVAASRARTPMEEATFVTLHKSGDLEADLARLRRDAGDRHLLVLPRPFDWMPGDVAADLLEHGIDPDATALVYERLTHDDEETSRTTVGDLAEHAGGGREGTPFSDLSVLVVRR